MSKISGSNALQNGAVGYTTGLGTNSWASDMEANLRAVDAGASHFSAIDLVSTLPGSPSVGDTYLTNPGAAQPNKVARYNGAAWEYFTPKAGWTAGLSNPGSGHVGRVVQFYGGIWVDGIQVGILNADSAIVTAATLGSADVGTLTQNAGSNTRLTSGGKFQGTGLNLSNGTSNAILKFDSSLNVVASAFSDDGTVAIAARNVFKAGAGTNSALFSWAGGSPVACWGHASGASDSTKHAIAQNQNFGTTLNSAAGQDLTFAIGNVVKATLRASGDFEFTGKATAALSGPIFKSGQTKVNSGAVSAATILPATCTLPSALLEQDKVLRVTIAGEGSGGSGGPTVLLKLGGTTLWNSAFTGIPVVWKITFLISVVSAGTSGSVRVNGWLEFNGTINGSITPTLTTVNTTVSQALDVQINGLSGQTFTTESSIIEAL